MKKYFSKTLILSLVVLVLAATPLLAKIKSLHGSFSERSFCWGL